MAQIFKTNFDSFVCDGESITAEHDGFKLRAICERDDDGKKPWDDDGHGPVSDWTGRAKRPGERILNTDGDSYRYYDFQEAVKLAKRDGWDSPPYNTGTAGERAVRAAEADFNTIKAWLDDKWDYCGICVEVSRAGVVLCEKYENALWGIERNYPATPVATRNHYLAEVANDLANAALESARAKLAELGTDSLVESLSAYVSADDVTLARPAFLRRVADRIIEDLESGAADANDEES